jgi:hypothetical protein
MSAFGGKADIGRLFRSACYFFILIVTRYETTATARWALLLIISALFNDTITAAVRTGFQVCLPVTSGAKRTS